MNRIVAWHKQKGFSYEADPRHVEILLEQLKLDDPKPVTTPGTKEEGQTQENKDEPLSERDATRYRALVARCNYLAPGRPVLAHAVKELVRSMANPRQGGSDQAKKTRKVRGRKEAGQTMV